VAGLALSTLCSDWMVFLESEGIKRRTRTSYLSATKTFLEFIATQGVQYDGISFKIATRWKVWLLNERKMKPRALNSALSAVRSFYRWLRIENYIYTDPLADIRCVKAPKLLPKPISEEWITKIIEAAETPFDRAFLETLYSCGGRIGEMESMRLGGVDLKAGMIKVMGKGDKERLVQIGSFAVKAIEAWLHFRAARGEALLPADPLWVGCRWLKMDKKTMRSHLRACATKAGFPEKIWPHRFRHSFGTHLLNRGANLREVQELLGHDNIVSTQIYTEVATARVRGAFLGSHPRA
jgi:integrase/recombinase XerD